MNLEAIALRRAEEQVSRHGAEIPTHIDWAAVQRPVSRTARQLKCICGHCHTCRNREAMRAARDAAPKRPHKPMGPSMALGRRCGCGQPISDKNRTGECQFCHRRQVSPAASRLAERGQP